MSEFIVKSEKFKQKLENILEKSFSDNSIENIVMERDILEKAIGKNAGLLVGLNKIIAERGYHNVQEEILSSLFDHNHRIIDIINEVYKPGGPEIDLFSLELKVLINRFNAEISSFMFDMTGRDSSANTASFNYNYAVKLYNHLGNRLFDKDNLVSRLVYMEMFGIFDKMIKINSKMRRPRHKFIKEKLIQYSHRCVELSEKFDGIVFLMNEVRYEDKIAENAASDKKNILRAHYNRSKAYYEISRRLQNLYACDDGKMVFSSHYLFGDLHWPNIDLTEKQREDPDTLAENAERYSHLGKEKLKKFVDRYERFLRKGEISEYFMARDFYYSRISLAENP